MLQYTKINNIDILHLKGSILHPESDDIRAKLEEVLIQEKKVIIDLLETQHICSSALGQIVFMKNKFVSVGGNIVLVVRDEDLLELLEITMLDQIFEVYSHTNEAMKILQNQS